MSHIPDISRSKLETHSSLGEGVYCIINSITSFGLSLIKLDIELDLLQTVGLTTETNSNQKCPIVDLVVFGSICSWSSNLE